MMKRTTTIICGVMLLLLSCNAAARYIDNFAPEWRGQPRTTLQQWDFIEGVPPEEPISPDSGSLHNPNGPVELFYYQGSTSGWVYDDYPGHTGVLSLAGSIRIDIPNYPDSNPYKDIVIQLVWAPETPEGKPLVEALPDHQDSGEFATLEEAVALDGEWQYSTYAVRLNPNPGFEQIWISGSILVDSIIIDTICIPEPATMLLLGLGGLIVRKHRR